MALDTFEWENGTLVEPAKVEIGGVSYDVTDAQYEGATPLSASNLNQMQTILNNNITTSIENQYNLVTDGNAVKTGRQIDGKDEWVKRFSFTTSGGNTYTKSLGFVLNDVIITKLEGTELSNTNNWWDANIGDTQGSSSYAQNVRLMHDDSTIVLTSNGNFSATYINVYYIYRN